MADKRYYHIPSTRQDKLLKYILAAAKANRNLLKQIEINKRISNDPMETN